MSNKTARVHTQVSNRQKPRTGKEKKDNSKVVFKSALDNPFRVQWPSIPINLQNVVLGHVSQLLDGYATYRQQCKKRKRTEEGAASKTKSKSKKRKLDQVDSGATPTLSAGPPTATVSTEAQQDDKMETDDRETDAWDHLVFGINAVTKVLETQVQKVRIPLLFSTSTSSTTSKPSASSTSKPADNESKPSGEKRLEYIFVCRADVDPPLLIDHIPPLVAAYNATMLGSSEETAKRRLIKLVVLPKGAEDALAQLLGIRRVTVLGFDDSYPRKDELTSILESVPIITAPWFAKPYSQLIPTHVKHVKTTAPTDMKATKEARTKGKEAAKERKRTRKEKQGEGGAKQTGKAQHRVKLS